MVTYTITFTDELGTASDETGSEITQAAEGTLVTITAKDRAEEGLLFTAWQAPEGLELADDTEEITTFTMPGSNVELAAEYAPLPDEGVAMQDEQVEEMIVGMLPTTALAANYNDVEVNGVALGDGKYLASNSATTANSSSTEPSRYVAWYKNGVLTLNGYNGKYIQVNGIPKSDLTVKLKGSNTITSSYRAGIFQNGAGGSITVTADSSSGKLKIDATYSNSIAGINNSFVAGHTLGDVTIKGYADVTINTTADSVTGQAYGIYGKSVSILENASVNIISNTPKRTSGSLCHGIYARDTASIDTAGKIKIDVTNAGTGNAHSYGIYVANRSLTLTKAAEMVVEWRKSTAGSTGGAPYTPTTASFRDTDHAINVDTTNCYASYRYGEPHTVMVKNGKLKCDGVVPNPKESGNFLAGDTVNITPSEKTSKDKTPIPFKEWTAEGVKLTSPTMKNTSFKVSANDVTVTATYNPFDGAPVFKSTSDARGTIEVNTVAKLGNSEIFQYVKDGETTYQRPYWTPSTTSTESPYQYIFDVTTYNSGDIRYLEDGDYRMVVTLNGEDYLSEPFTVSYAAAVTTYTVSFDANGGTGSMADATGVSGDYELPVCGFTAPNGKQFKAWSVGGVEKAVGDKITVTANTTVTAVWEDIPVVTYTVSFDANGGTGTMADVTGVSGEYTLPANGFTAPAGKQFKAWSVGGVEKAAGDKITVTANTTVTAVWEAIEYNITVTDGKATIGAGSEISKAAQGTIVTLTANAAPSDKVFDKWEVVSGGITLADANSATTTFTMPAGAVSVKATYTTYITVNLAAGEGSGTMEPIIIKNTYGYFSLTAPECTFTAPANKVFDKWQFSKDDSYLKPGDTKTIWSSADGATLTAIWKDAPVTEYDITVTDGKATVGAGTEITKAAEGTTVTLTANAAPTDMVFDKWEVVSGGITLADVNSATTTFTMPASAVSVKATYKTKPVTTYNLTTQVNGGHGTISAGKTGLTAGSTETITFNPEVGYEIDTVTVNGTATSVSGNTLNVTMNENKNVVVTYKAIEYTITVTDGKATNGAGSEISKAAQGKIVTLTANAAPSDKVFDKWEVVSGGITLADVNSATTTFTMPASTVSVKATYKDSHTHTLTSVPEKAATCTDKGNHAYYTCTCGKWFADESGTVEITDKTSVEIAPLNHDWNAPAYTWNADNTVCTATRTCKRDAGHKETATATVTSAQTKAPTCTAKGETTYTAAFTEAWANTQTKTVDNIAALGHDWSTAWTGDSTGHWHKCTRCDATTTKAAHDYGSDNVCDTCGYDKTVPHTHNLTLVAAKAATCTTAGNSAYYTCDGCDKWFADATGSVEITDKTSVKIPATGHTAGTEWKSDDTNHWHECTVAGCGVIIESTKSAHTAGEWIVDTPATATTAGTKHKECTVCKKVLETAMIPALVKIDVAKLTVAKPAKDALAAAATTGDSAYTVTSTQWTAADGTTLAVGEKFKPGTVYTVKITLKAKENNVFTADSTYNKIEGKDAKLVTAVTGNTDSVILTYTFDATEGVAYNITDGANGVWVKGSTGALRFTADGEYAKFKSVQIDGTELAKENYTAAAGSTVITLKNEYLSTLAAGKHTIAIIYDDGDCSTSFTVHQHTYGAWSSDDTHHWHECTDASCPDKTASVINKAEHNFVWQIDVPASQASTGTKHEECTVCGKKRNENTVIEKLPGSSSGSGSHHSSSNSNNNNNTGTEAAAPEAAAPAPAASAPVTTTTSARTGDSSNLIGWLAVLLISGGAAGAWYTVAKKKKEQ